MDKNNKDLEKLMKQASQEVDENVTYKKKTNSNKKVIGFTALGASLFIGVLVAGSLFLKNDNFVDKTKDPNWVNEKQGEIVIEHQHTFPIELKEWAKFSYNKEEFWAKENIEQEIIDYVREDLSTFFSLISYMPTSWEHGRDDLNPPKTNNPDKMLLEDGSDNPDFSYTVAEDYHKALAVYGERLINPMFGGWAVGQEFNPEFDNRENDSFKNLEDMFTKRWWGENVVSNNGKYDKLPILAEWDKNSWGEYEFYADVDRSYGVFYGELLDDDENLIKTETLGVDEFLQPIVKVDIPVEFHAFDKNKKDITKKGVLSLTLVYNKDELNLINNVLIDEASLSLDK